MKPGRYFWIILIFICVSPAFADTRNRAIVASVAEEQKDCVDQKILTAIARDLDIHLTFHYAPFKRRLLMLKSGSVDIVAGLLRRPERETYIHFVLPPYKNKSDTIFLVPKGNAGLIRVYEDLKGLRIGVNQGSKFFPQFDKDTALHKEPVHLITANLKKMLLGRLDTVIINEAAGIDLIRRTGLAQEIEIAQYRFSRAKCVYIGISKRSWLMNEINTIAPKIKKMVESGRIGKIIRNYYLDHGLPVPAF